MMKKQTKTNKQILGVDPDKISLVGACLLGDVSAVQGLITQLGSDCKDVINELDYPKYPPEQKHKLLNMSKPPPPPPSIPNKVVHSSHVNVKSASVSGGGGAAEPEDMSLALVPFKSNHHGAGTEDEDDMMSVSEHELMSPLMAAARYGHLSVVRRLLREPNIIVDQVPTTSLFQSLLLTFFSRFFFSFTFSRNTRI
jgi:hypothetical protein